MAKKMHVQRASGTQESHTLKTSLAIAFITHKMTRKKYNWLQHLQTVQTSP